MQLVSVNFDIGAAILPRGCGFAIRIAIFVQGEHTWDAVAAGMITAAALIAKRRRVSLETYTAIGAFIDGCGSYPTSSKSSNLKSWMFLMAGFNFNRGNGRNSRESCWRA